MSPREAGSAANEFGPGEIEGVARSQDRNLEAPGPSAATGDPLEAEARKMTDAELRACIEGICGNPKRAGSRARRLSMSESLALAALMAEEARRVHA